MTITKKLSLMILTVSIVLGSVLSFILYIRISELIKDQIIHSQIENSKNIMQNINQTLLQGKRDILMLSEDEFLQDFIAAPDKNQKSYLLLKAELQERMEITGPWDYLTVVNSNGKRILSIGKNDENTMIDNATSDFKAFKMAMNGILYISDFLMSEYTHKPMIIYANTIINEEGQALGVLIAHFRWSNIEQLMAEFSSNMHLHLFNKEGIVIAAVEKNKVQHHFEAFSHHPLIKQAIAKKDVITSLSTSLHGVENTATVVISQKNYKDLHTFNWKLMLEQPTKSLFSKVSYLAIQAGGIIFLLLLLLTIFLSFLTRKILLPLSNLTELSTKLGQGEFTKVAVHSNDEIGILSKSFNAMTDKLHSHINALRDSENRFSHVVNSISDIIYQASAPDFRPTFVNEAVESLLGFTPKEILDTPDIRQKQILEEDLERVMLTMNTAYETNVDFNLEYRILHKDGKTMKWLEERGKWERDSQGNIVALYGVISDITDRKNAEKKIEKSSRALSAIHTVDTLINRSVDENDLIQGVCDKIVTEAGYPFSWVGIMDSHGDDMHFVAHTDRKNTLTHEINDSLINFKNIDDEIYSILQTQDYYVITDMKVKNGVNHYLINSHTDEFNAIIIFALKSEDTLLGMIAIYSDQNDSFDHDEINLLKDLTDNLAYAISALRTQELHREAEKKISYQAYHDSLTGLPNRFMFMENLHQTISYSKRYSESFAVLFIDLDDFKLVNDTLGHKAGDQLLCAASQRLKEVVRDSDIVARQSGDEFIILMRWSSSKKNSEYQPHTEKIESIEAALLATRIINSIKEPFIINGQNTYVGASIGISIYPDDADDEETLLSHADSAMYNIKNLGKGGYQFYSSDLTERQQKRMSIFNNLHHAIEKKEFVLHYQPIVDLKSGSMVGLEALIRWRSDTGILIPPNEFLPVAEDTGLIIPIGDWIVEEVCRQIKLWQAEGINIYVALNLSVRQFLKEDLSTKVLHIIEKNGISKKSIELEITESALSLDSDRMESIIKTFYDEGINISLDDFGTGYSSLTRLKKLPIKTLKVDKSFVDGIPYSEDDTAIVTAILQLAKSLNISSLSEGVETTEQYEWLCKHGCQYAQGYYFSRPVPASEIKELINTNFSEKLKNKENR